MATISKLESTKGETRFRARIRLRGYADQSATFGSKTEARKWIKVTEAAIIEGRHGSSHSTQRILAQAVDRYIEDNLESISPSEQANRKRHLEYFKKHLGKMSLQQLCNDAEPIRQQMKKIAREPTLRSDRRSGATCNRFYASLSKLFTCAMKWGWATSNPMRLVEKFPEPKGRDRYLSDDELERLMAATANSKDPYLDVVVKLALTTGGRRGEILGLTWKDVSLERETLTFRKTKNDEIRTVPLVDPALSLVQELHTRRRTDTDLLFAWSNPNKPKDIRTAWLKALDEAQIEDFRFHDLRHTCASYLAMSGASPSELAATLGHKTLAMVKRYSHVSEAHTADLLRKMAEKRLSGKSE